MNYELAKELKDAGYSQEELNDDSSIRNVLDGIHHEHVYYPTLSELIEACGAVAFELNATPSRGHNNTWFAGVEDLSAENVYLAKATGLTPEEAVARLWLALNKV